MKSRTLFQKGFYVLILILMIVSLSSCSNESDQDDADITETTDTIDPTIAVGVPNPIRESSAEDILETLGFTMNIPDKAQSVVYSIIEMGEGNPIAEAEFSLNDIQYSYRIQSAEAMEDISGAYFDWTTNKAFEIAYCSGEIKLIEGSGGICLWYDVVPGLTYSIYMETNASETLLSEMANTLYIPAKDAP